MRDDQLLDALTNNRDNWDQALPKILKVLLHCSIGYPVSEED